MRTVTELHENWTFKQADDDRSQFQRVAQFPTNIHLDLFHHGFIPDPFFAKNELAVQWVAEKAWIYRTVFSMPATHIKVDEGFRIDLVFEGLDTYATVDLNGSEILKTENMFTPERVDVTTLLARLENVLTIRFESALLVGREIVQAHPEHLWGCWNGEPSRVGVRKAQYHYVNDSSFFVS